MNARSLLVLSLLSASPSIVLAQPYPEPPAPAIAPAPKAPTAPRAVVALRPAVASMPAIAAAPEAVPLPPAAEMPQAPKAAPAPAPAAPAPAPAAPAAPVPPRPMGQMVNVRIDVTLSDSKGGAKVLTMTVADGESGMNRTTSLMPPGTGSTDYSFNADARPSLVGNKIRLGLTADAVVPVDADKAGGPPVIRLAMRQSQTVILNDGDSVEIARAADPVSDRVFILSVKVKIQR